MARKGIVVSGRIDLDARIMSGSIDPLDLRRYVVYWDEIAYPKIDGIGPNFDALPDLQILRSEGRLIDQDVHIVGDQMDVNPTNPTYPHFVASSEGMRKHLAKTITAQAKLIEYNSHHLGGHWSLAQTGSKLIMPPGLEQAQLVELSLYQALPAPSSETPLEEVLEFVRRRSGELERFRHVMDRIYDNLTKSPDIERAKTIAQRDLQTAILDLNRVMNESRIERVKSSFKVLLDPGETVASLTRAGAGAAGGTLFSTGFGTALGAGLGFLEPVIKATLKRSPKIDDLKYGLRDYAYLYLVDERFGQSSPR